MTRKPKERLIVRMDQREGDIVDRALADAVDAYCRLNAAFRHGWINSVDYHTALDLNARTIRYLRNKQSYYNDLDKDKQ